MAKAYECPEPRGHLLEYKKRATMEHINRYDAIRFWRGENVILEIEKRTIEKALQNMAREAVSLSEEQVKAMWENEIRPVIIKEYTEPSPTSIKSMEETYREYIEKNIGKSYSVGLIFKILFFLAVLLEIAIMVIQTVFMVAGGEYVEITPMLMAVFYGLLLALGGWLTGMFFGTWVFDTHLEKNHMAGAAESQLSPLHWFLLTGGIALILFVAIVRAVFGGGLLAFLITLILGLVVTTLKAFWDYYDKLRCFNGVYRLAYFSGLASREHAKNMDRYKEVFFEAVRKQKEQYR